MDQTLAKFEGRNISLAPSSPSSPSSPFLSSTSSGSTSSSIGQTKKDNSSLSTSSSSVLVRGGRLEMFVQFIFLFNFLFHLL